MDDGGTAGLMIVAAPAEASGFTYFWQARYSGGASNEPSVSECGAETEVVLSSARHGADLGVGLVVQPASPKVSGDEFVIWVTVTDYGPKPASNVISGVLLPGGLTVDSAGGGRQLGGLLIWAPRRVLGRTDSDLSRMGHADANRQRDDRCGRVAACDARSRAPGPLPSRPEGGSRRRQRVGSRSEGGSAKGVGCVRFRW